MAASSTETLVAEVNCNAAYRNVVKAATPVTVMNSSGLKCCRNSGAACRAPRYPTGSRTTNAIATRRNAMVNGGRSSSAFPTRMLPE